MPENKKVKIVPIKQSVNSGESGYIMLDYDRPDPYYILGIEARKKGKRKSIHIKSLPYVMHESTHLFDFLLNPKYLMNMAKMNKLDIWEKPYFKIYDELYYNPEHTCEWGLRNKKKILKDAEIKTKTALKDVPFEEKLTFLNFIKYSMQTELNAYNQEFHFANLLKNTRNFAAFKKCRNLNDYYHFAEKIKLVNALIKETLENKRHKGDLTIFSSALKLCQRLLQNFQ